MYTMSESQTAHPSRILISFYCSYGFRHLFAFTAQGLIPSLLGSLFLDLCQVTILEGLDASSFVETLVASSPTIARLTAMVHLKKGKDGKMVGTKYAWAHPAMRPWGHELPVQCSDCYSIRSFFRVKIGDPDIPKFKCRGKHIDGSSCTTIRTFEAKDGMKPVKKSYWLSSPWPDYDVLPEKDKHVEEASKSGSEYQDSN
jgi:hypothetical protein